MKALRIYCFAQLADPTVEHFSVSATRFMSGKFPAMIFGLPGAALAIYKSGQTGKTEAGSRAFLLYLRHDFGTHRYYRTSGVYLLICQRLCCM